MKKILLKIAFIVLVILACSNSSKAVVIFDFNVIIQYDSCSPTGYQGNYLVFCTIKSNNGTILCTGQKTGISYRLIGQRVEVKFDCNIPDQDVKCDYELDITVCRQTAPTPTCCKNFYFINQCWSCLIGSGGSLCDYPVYLN
jgi:hypothetical protein